MIQKEKIDKYSVIGYAKNKKITMKAVHIKWDTDGDVELLEKLPTEVEIPDYLITDNEDDLLDHISDWLSDEFGFCHGGFELINKTNKNKMAKLY